MARIVTKAFTLNLPEGQKQFVVGDSLEGSDAEHWYSLEHSEEVVVSAKAETAAEKKAREKAEKAAAAEAEAIAKAQAEAEAAEAEAKAKAETESADANATQQ